MKDWHLADVGGYTWDVEDDDDDADGLYTDADLRANLATNPTLKKLTRKYS